MVWVAPPCGTAYRAREIRRGGPHGRPKPLRSDRYPEGIPGLAGVAAAKVTAANELYRHEKGKSSSSSKIQREVTSGLHECSSQHEGRFIHILSPMHVWWLLK